MQIISWNIQCGQGVDGQLDLHRIVKIMQEMGSADVICLQEVVRGNPDLDGGAGQDQLAELAALLPDYQPVFGAAIDRQHSKTGKRWQFGNAIFTKAPAVQIFRHQLPQPAPEAPAKHMPRQATEIIIETSRRPLRITTTHLEFHSITQRLAQMRHLRDLFKDVVYNQDYQADSLPDDPYAAVMRPAASILCGDFNAVPGDEEHRALTAPLKGSTDHYIDAWPKVHGIKEHAATCGIFDHQQWPEGAHCRDYFFVSSALVPELDTIVVQSQTNASDHQPVALTLKL